MLNYIIRRLLLMFPTLIGVTMLVFFIMAYAPNGFAAMLNEGGGQNMGDSARRIKQYNINRYALDKPKAVQYLRWLNTVSPVGFEMSDAYVWSQEDKDALDEALGQRDWAGDERGQTRAANLILLAAIYSGQTPMKVLDLYDDAAQNPADDGAILFELIDAEPINGDEFWNDLDKLQAENVGAALGALHKELTYGSENKSRILFNDLKLAVPNLGEDKEGRDVAKGIGQALKITLLMNLITVPIIYLVSVISGVYASRKRGGAFDVGSGIVMLAMYSVPVIWAGTLFISYFANVDNLRWFPASGVHDIRADEMAFLPTMSGLFQSAGFSLHVLICTMAPVGFLLAFGMGISFVKSLIQGKAPAIGLMVVAGMSLALAVIGLVEFYAEVLPTAMPDDRGWVLDMAWHLILPIICLTYTGFAFLTKVMRGSMLENITADFVRTARAKGVSEKIVLFRHVLRNAMLPLITMAAAILPGLFVGSFVVEYIFSINGMGKMTIVAAKNTDVNIVMATTLVGAVLSLFSLLVRDILYAVADPRVSYE